MNKTRNKKTNYSRPSKDIEKVLMCVPSAIVFSYIRAFMAGDILISAYLLKIIDSIKKLKIYSKKFLFFMMI